MVKLLEAPTATHKLLSPPQSDSRHLGWEIDQAVKDNLITQDAEKVLQGFLDKPDIVRSVLHEAAKNVTI